LCLGMGVEDGGARWEVNGSAARFSCVHVEMLAVMRYDTSSNERTNGGRDLALLWRDTHAGKCRSCAGSA
jgi:hypothetical protein